MQGYKEVLKNKMDEFVREVFVETRNFPREEIYITTSQLKRAVLSIILNYVEGYARFRPKNQLNFLETSYGSLKEVNYLLYFSWKQSFLSEDKYKKLIKQLDEIGAMLWTEIKSLTKSLGD